MTSKDEIHRLNSENDALAENSERNAVSDSCSNINPPQKPVPREVHPFIVLRPKPPRRDFETETVLTAAAKLQEYNLGYSGDTPFISTSDFLKVTGLDSFEAYFLLCGPVRTMKLAGLTLMNASDALSFLEAVKSKKNEVNHE